MIAPVLLAKESNFQPSLYVALYANGIIFF